MVLIIYFYDSPYFFSSQVFKEAGNHIEMVELGKVFRQESRHFLRLLEAIRTNEIDYDDLEDLNERWMPDFTPEEGYITLCARILTGLEYGKQCKVSGYGIAAGFHPGRVV